MKNGTNGHNGSRSISQLVQDLETERDAIKNLSQSLSEAQHRVETLNQDLAVALGLTPAVQRAETTPVKEDAAPPTNGVPKKGYFRRPTGERERRILSALGKRRMTHAELAQAIDCAPGSLSYYTGVLL